MSTHYWIRGIGAHCGAAIEDDTAALTSDLDAVTCPECGDARIGFSYR